MRKLFLAAVLAVMLTVGANVSTWISWLLVASTLSELSRARYLTVVVVETVNAPV